MKVYVVLMESSRSARPEQVEAVRVEGTFSSQGEAVTWCQGVLTAEGYRTFDPVRSGENVHVLGSVTGEQWRIKRFTISEHYNDNLVAQKARGKKD